MSRSKKLLLVGLVLAVGFGLAWPFRHASTDRVPADGVTADKTFDSVAKTQANDFGGTKTVAVQPNFSQPPQVGSPAPHVSAKMTSLGEADVSAKNSAPTASFDLANHPALATPQAPRADSPVTSPLPPKVQPSPSEYLPAQVEKYRGHARPAYSTADRDRGLDVDPQHKVEVRHVVQNSDTLEKLAKRYLGDEGRALEIFDLNRDVLDNPHLLPIEAELRIPADARMTVEP